MYIDLHGYDPHLPSFGADTIGCLWKALSLIACSVIAVTLFFLLCEFIRHVLT